MRDEHCSNAIVNNGRCIAFCHYNLNLEPGDCTGNDNPILDGIKPIPVVTKWQDPAGMTFDSKGYPVAKEPTTNDDTVIDPTDVHTDQNGWTWVWASTPAGVRYKKYLTTLSSRQGVTI
jgi:hypothetical protein